MRTAQRPHLTLRLAGPLMLGALVTLASCGGSEDPDAHADTGIKNEPAADQGAAPGDMAPGDLAPGESTAPDPGGADSGGPDSSGAAGDGDTASGGSAEPALTGEAAVAALRAHVAELKAKDEHTDPSVEVAHILISFKEAGIGATRSRDEAELLAAEVWAQVVAEGGFEALRKEHTEDPGPRLYKMSLKPTQGMTVRTGMVPAFGNVGWRLAPGEVGVAAHDPAAPGDSPFGWHIVKRVR